MNAPPKAVISINAETLKHGLADLECLVLYPLDEDGELLMIQIGDDYHVIGAHNLENYKPAEALL